MGLRITISSDRPLSGKNELAMLIEEHLKSLGINNVTCTDKHGLSFYPFKDKLGNVSHINDVFKDRFQNDPYLDIKILESSEHPFENDDHECDCK
jgi:hypothetical protein